MKETILELWDGNIIRENWECKNDEKKILGYIERHRNDLLVKLDDKGKESFKRFEDCFDELLDIECRNAFEKGFSLAAKLVAEALIE